MCKIKGEVTLSILSIVLQILLGLGFLMFGYQKFTSDEVKQGFHYFGYGDGFRRFTGVVEVLAGLIVLAGMWIGALETVGGIMIVRTMIGAIITDVKIKYSIKNMSMPIILFIMGGIVMIINWNALF